MTLENVEDIFPLTPVQEGLLFHCLSTPGLYLEQFDCVLEGALDGERLRRAWHEVLACHQALRSLCLWEGLDEPLQVVRQTCRLDWTAEDSPPQDWAGHLAEDRRRGLDLGAAPVMRVALFRLEEERHRLLWTFHHLFLDAWSRDLVWRDVWAAYRGELGPAPRPVSDYVAWLQERDLASAQPFWTRALQGWTEPTPLGVDEPQPQGRQERLSFEVPAAGLRDLARRCRVTLSTVFLGLWATLLSRLAGTDGVLFGVTSSGRPSDLPGSEGMVGMFLSTFPLAVEVPQECPEAWLGSLQGQATRAREFEWVPLAQIKKWSSVPPDRPLFESLVVFENHPERPPLLAPGLTMQEAEHHDQSNYPLVLLVEPGDPLRLLVLYDPGRIPTERARLLGGHLVVLGRRWAGEDRADAEPPPPPALEVPRIGIDQLVPRGDAPALEGLSYRELGQRVDGIMKGLLEAGVEPGDRVALVSERTPEAVAAILGVLKAGAAYVPVDPRAGARRMAAQLEGVRAVLATASSRPPGATVLLLEDLEPDLSGTLPSRSGAELPAYRIFTSGSTGRPKAVEVSHRALVASTLARSRYYREAPARFLLVTHPAYDSSVAGLFWTLTTGSELVVCPPGAEQDPDALLDLIETRRVTHTLCLPSLYAALLDRDRTESLRSLRAVIVAGEACPATLAQRHHRALPACELYNEYGPTEATVWCSVYRTTGREERRVPIGEAAPHSRLYLLDELRRPVPAPAAGELYVGGDFLAQGYAGVSSEERFEPDPFRGEGRMYRTGDRARLDHDGQLYFLGRADRQVKLRGYRVELGEVEAALESHPAVGQAAVEVEDGRLEAFLAPRCDLDEVRRYLDEQVPPFMVPSRVHCFDRLPLLPNGKLDRRALPQAPPPVLPRTEHEAFLTRVFAQALGRESVGVNESFFELGGDSMTSIAIVSRVRAEGLSLSPEQLFLYPTIAELAPHLQPAAPPAAPAEFEDSGLDEDELHALLEGFS